MEANESTGRELDSRFKLEEDVRATLGSYKAAVAANLYMHVLGWLDRQHEITERYWKYLCGCTTRASAEINKKLKVAEAENEDLRKELETAKRECVKVNRLELGLRELTTKHEGLIWQLTDGLLSKASTPNESVVSEVEEWHRRQCDKEHSDLVAENEALRKRLQDRIDNLQMENACLLNSINSLRDGLLRDWHIVTEWSDRLNSYVIRLEDSDASMRGLRSADASSDKDTREKVEGSLARLIVGICAARLRTDKTNMELVARFKNGLTRILDRQAAITAREVERDMTKAGHVAVEIERERIADQRATIERQRDAISRFKTAYDAVRGLFDDDAMSALGIEVGE